MKEHKKGVAAVSSEIVPYRVAHQMTLIHDHKITTASESADCLLKKAFRATFAITNHADGVELWLALSRRRTRFMRRGENEYRDESSMTRVKKGLTGRVRKYKTRRQERTSVFMSNCQYDLPHLYLGLIPPLGEVVLQVP